ncbi:MAG: hypothetical protein ABL864_01905 [Terricaulis sp.]
MIRTLRIKALAFAALMAPASLLAATDTARAQAAPNVAGPVREYQAQPPARTRPLRDGVTGLGATQDVVREPRFIVEAVSFLAVDESGWTDLGSDEVFAVFSDVAGSGGRTSTFEDIDTSVGRNFDREQSCILPAIDPDGALNKVWACAPEGTRGPLNFSIGLYDEDVPSGWGGFSFHCGTGVGDLGACSDGHHTDLFNHDFTYDVAQILSRLDPSCRCFEETARQSRDDSDAVYEVTFRITRVDTAGEPLGLDRNPPGATGPIVHRSGSLTAQLTQGFELDGGTVVTIGADFIFSRIPFTNMYFLTPNGGAKIWPGGVTARGYASCYAERASANYLTTAVTPATVGPHACYVTGDGRVGELQVTDFTPGGAATLSIDYTTWQ